MNLLQTNNNHRRLPSLFSSSREDVFYPVQQLFDQIYDEFFSEAGRNSVKSRQGFPRWDVYYTDQEYVVEVSASGMKAEDVKVEILPAKESGDTGHGRILKVSGRMAEDYQRGDDVNYVVRELRRSSFERSMYLPDYCVDDPVATMKDGILRLTWKRPSPPKSETKMIPIQKLDD